MEYDYAMYRDECLAYQAGQKKINISATCLTLVSFNKAMHIINQDLN